MRKLAVSQKDRIFRANQQKRIEMSSPSLRAKKIIFNRKP